jgi:hypothetical protein
MVNIKLLFQEHRGEYRKFELVHPQLSRRPDLHAFLLLNKLVPGCDNIISAAEHDEIWLSIDPEDLGNVLTEDLIIELIRCGVRYSAGSLLMQPF